MTSAIQLHSLGTPNGQKVSIALEEMDLPYEAHRVNILKGEQFLPAFTAISPYSKIPAIVDPDGPGAQPIALAESGAILIYLAEKSGKFLPKDPRQRAETLQWLFFQVGGEGPMFGQFGHFHKYAKEKIPYAIERYKKEAQRVLGVLEKRLEKADYLAAGSYTIADMAAVPWVNCLSEFYEAGEVLELASFPKTLAWAKRISERPKAAKGLKVLPPGG